MLGSAGMGSEIPGIDTARFGSAIWNPAIDGSANKGTFGISGIGIENPGIDTNKFGRFNGNEQTGTANTGIAGISGIAKPGIGMDTDKLGKAQLLMVFSNSVNKVRNFCHRMYNMLDIWWYLNISSRNRVKRKYSENIEVIFVS
jgi:hypothetical protein